MRFDLHVHTTVSPCSNLDMGDILQNARGFGLDGICITDHQTMKIRHSFKEGVQDDGLCVIVGMEYTTSDGDFLVFGTLEDISPDLSAVELFERLEKCGGVAVAAHPFRNLRPVDEYLIQEGLCGIIETVNGRNSYLENLRADHCRRKYDLTHTGGSDAHSLEELGKVVTRFTMPVKSRSDLVFALKNNRCYPEWNMPGQLSRAGIS